MNFEHSEKVLRLRKELIAFRDREIYPHEAQFEHELEEHGRFAIIPILEALRAKAKAAGLWNLFLDDPEHGAGLTNLEYAPLAEIMGCNEWTPETFNCNPPDSGNIELLRRYADAEQKARWLAPLMAGDIRSSFAMTEPGVASSDATNIQARAERDGNDWVLNGRKWWISGPGSPACAFTIVMCRTGDDATSHLNHSMFIVPLKAPGVTIVRQLKVFGFDHAPRGQSELCFSNVRIPTGNVIFGIGRGFEIAQGRLGSGRIHHAMRCIGAAERAMDLMCRRSQSRRAFGRKLSDLGGNPDVIAQSRVEIEMARLLVLRAADRLDRLGAKAARSEISQAKLVAPTMALAVVDRAIQMHGAEGLSQDSPLPALFARLRTLRLADGPDEVHRRVIAKEELAPYSLPKASAA
jgi:acyl-CoA dehydrogenase